MGLWYSKDTGMSLTAYSDADHGGCQDTRRIVLDNALVPLEKRVEIGKCNMRINPEKTQKEPTYQVFLDTLALTTCYPAFLITADIDKKRFTLNVEVFREIFWICPNLLNQEIDALHSDEEIVSFIRELGHKGDIKSITKVVVDQMYQPLRTFDAIIKKCLSGKITVYGALLPEVMPNQKMQDSPAYKTYLAFATGATSPKKARKFKKPASPLRKRTLVTIEEEEPEPVKKVVPSKKSSRKQSIGVQIQDTPGVSVSKKKVSTTKDKSKGIDLLSEAAYLRRLKPVCDTHIMETSIETRKGYESWGDSGDEANVQGDDEDVQDSNDDPQQANDERTDFENQETNDDEEETDNEFVHTPEDYLYGDFNVRVLDVVQDDEGEEDADMINVAHVQVEQTQEQTTGVQEESGAEMAMGSMLDINVQHEAPRSSILLTIHVSVILKHTVFNPSEIVTTTLATTITSLLSSLFPNLQQSTPIPTPTTTEATTLTFVVPESETLSALHKRITNIKKDVKELKDVDNSTTVIATIKSEIPNAVKEYLGSSLDDALHKVIQRYFADVIKEHSIPAEIVERLRQQYVPQKSIEDIREIKMDHARKQQVPKETITSSDTTALEEFDQKTTSFNTMTKSKSFNKSPKHRALYHALMESILEDEDVMDKGKSPATSLKSSKSGKSIKDQVVKPIFVQDSDNAEHDDVDYAYMPMDQEKDLGNTDEQPNDEAVPKNDWYKKSKSDTSPDPNPEWNKGKSVDDGPEQSWLNDMAKDTKPPLIFDELMHTPIDFFAFAMNRLKIDNLTKELLVGPVYNLLKGTCKSYVDLDYTTEECYRALSEQLDWNNPEGHCCLYDLTKPIPVQISSQGRQIIPADFFFNNDLEYLRGGSNDKKYTASTTRSKAARYELKGIEEMVPNLWSPVKVVYDRYALLGISH
ncbi:hypothetical protein Tco_0986231 [Tanacetum coccineum]